MYSVTSLSTINQCSDVNENVNVKVNESPVRTPRTAERDAARFHYYDVSTFSALLSQNLTFTESLFLIFSAPSFKPPFCAKLRS